MRTIPLDSPKFLGSNTIPTRLDKLARHVVLSRLEKLEEGRIIVSEYDRQYRYGVLTDACPLAAHVVVHDPKFYSDIAFGGTVGSGEAYIHGHWSCDDLTTLIRILLMNRHVIEEVESGAAVLTRPMRKLFHWLNRNTRQGSQRNIAAHYDLGNDFYRLWLDEQMMYSSAYFESSDMTLDQAAVAKLDRVCRKLDLSANDSVMEIGSGWGGFAVHAAKNYGCHVTTTTISNSQYDFARRRIAEEGLEDRITLLDRDYRDLEGEFDKLVSIEMIEAVGHEFHSTFFQKCCELLKPDGQMLLQAITIADQRYVAAKNSVDFIKRYIFPGGSLTSVTDMAKTLTSVTDMRVIHLEDIGPHYALTLRHWHERFLERLDEIRRLDYSDEFIRMWQFYLSYCESAFIERAIGTVQTLAMRPLARRDSIIY